MIRRTTVSVLVIASVATVVYLVLGSVLPGTPEGNAMRENLTVLSVVLSAISGILVAAAAHKEG